MGNGDKPCCAALAAAKLQYLVIGGHRIAIAGLEIILSKAQEASRRGEDAIRAVLIEQAEIFNYVPPSAGQSYEDALFREYRARNGTGRAARKGEGEK